MDIFVFGLALLSGLVGSLLGLGGGIILVPALSLFLGMHIKYVVALSLISIIVSSLTSSKTTLLKQLPNIRIANFLEVGTVFGALSGFYIAKLIDPKWIFILFGLFLIFSLYSMIKNKNSGLAQKNDVLAEKLNLRGSYPNQKNELEKYYVTSTKLSLFVMYIAGVLSAILGIGSGVMKTLSMDTLMKLPIKVSTSTSNYMISVTALASALSYFLQGYVLVQFLPPILLGSALGAFLGTKILLKISSAKLRILFMTLLFVMAFQMILRGIFYET